MMEPAIRRTEANDGGISGVLLVRPVVVPFNRFGVLRARVPEPSVVMPAASGSKSNWRARVLPRVDRSQYRHQVEAATGRAHQRSIGELS